MLRSHGFYAVGAQGAYAAPDKGSRTKLNLIRTCQMNARHTEADNHELQGSLKLAKILHCAALGPPPSLTDCTLCSDRRITYE